MSTETDTPVTVRFPTEPREPLAEELRSIMEWIYRHEHRGELVSEQLWYLVDKLENRAWCRGNDHLPISDEAE